MKKILLIFLCVALMSSCQEKESRQDKIAIKWGVIPDISIEKDSEVEKYIEEKYNVSIETVSISNDEQLSAVIAAGNTPDVMYLREPEIWIPLARQSALAPLTVNQIKSNAPRHYENMKSAGENIIESGMDNEKLWVVPKIDTKESVHVGILRKDWLEKLGLEEEPKTLEDYEKIFREFTYGDPDGNGIDDTYGFTGMGAHQPRQFDSIFGAFGVMPGQWKVHDAVVSTDTVSPKAKEALELLNKWYEAGYIHPECVTDSVRSSSYKFISGQVGVVFDSLDLFEDSTLQGKRNLSELRKRCPDAKICFSYAPTGSEGYCGSYMWGPRTNYIGFGSQLKDKPEVINHILRIMDELNYDEKTAIRQYWGVEGETFKFSDNNQTLAFINEYIEEDARAEAGLGGAFNGLSGLNWASDDIYEKYLSSKLKETKKKYEVASNVGYDVLLRPFLPSTIALQSKLDNFKSISYSKFIIGERPLSEWDQFVEEFMKLGGAQLQREAQELYDSKFQ